MAQYNLSHTGQQLDAAVEKYLQVDFNSFVDSATLNNYVTTAALNTKLEDYLNINNAASIYAPLTGTGTSGTWPINITGSSSIVVDSGNSDNTISFSYYKAGLDYSDYTWIAAWNGYELRAVNKNQFQARSITNDLYVISKDTGSSTSIAITVPGHANATYDRISIWSWGSMNNTIYYGVVSTSSAADGTSPSATYTGNRTVTCTYANSGSDRVITLTGLPSWGTMHFISRIKIT